MAEQEFLAGRTTDFQNGDMKEVAWSEKKIIVAKAGDRFYAVGSVCPHYKAPLINGALCGTRLYCPWHHSSFDITDGALCDPPAFDALPHYHIRIEGENIFIGKERATESPTMSATFSDKTFVLLGAGAAGLMAAQTLRQEGFGGKILMITKEAALPYDRPALSKKVMSNKSSMEDATLKPVSFFEENNITVLKNKEVMAVGVAAKTISFSNGERLTYDKLLLATGGEAKQLPIQGGNLPNVFVLRTAGDAAQILNAVKDAKKISLVGASFIATEVAASLHSTRKEVTIFAKEKVPFEAQLGAEIGNMLLALHRAKGVAVITEADIEKIDGTEKAVAIVLKNGTRYETDAVVVGIGVHPATGYVTGLQRNEKDNSIVVNEFLEAANDVFAAGDIASYPGSKAGKTIRVEHWRLAQQQGMIAAKNMLGQHVSVRSIVPFFWTNQFDARLNYVGHAEDWDEIVVDGNVAEQNFVAYYVKGGNVLAAASMKRDKESILIEHLMRNHPPMSVAEMRSAISS